MNSRIANMSLFTSSACDNFSLDGDDYLLHLHIPKCAGKSLRASILRSTPKDLCIEYNSTDPFDTKKSLEGFSDIINRFPRARIISGHFPYGVHSVIPSGKKYKYISILRNPIERIISQYRHSMVYNLSIIDQDEAQFLANSSFLDYVLSEYGIITYINSQARLVSGLLTNSELYQFSQNDFRLHVLAILEKDFLCVGLDSSLPDLLKLLEGVSTIFAGLSENNVRVNVGLRLATSDVFSQEEVDRLCKSSEYDFSLLMALFGLDQFPCISFAPQGRSREFINKALLDSALEMARQLRLFRAN